MKSFTELVNYLSGTSKDVRVEHQPPDQKETAMQYDMALIGNRPKPVYIEATITNFTKGGAAFAREADGMRDIFVPVAVVERMELDRGDQVIATTVPNRLYESWTPDLGVLRPAELFAIHIVKADESAIRAMQDASAAEQMIKVKTIEERLIEALEHGPCRAAMLSKHFDIKVDTIFNRLEGLHRDGLVARSSIYATQGQANASYVVWALDAKELIPELAELEVPGEDDDLPNLQG